MTTAAADENESPRRAVRVNLVSLVVTGAIFLWLLYAVASGLGYVHEHRAPPRDAVRTATGGRVLVYVSPLLGEAHSPSSQVGHVFLGGFFAVYEDVPLVPRPELTDEGGTRIDLHESEVEDPNVPARLTFIFTPEVSPPVRITAPSADGEPRPLSGTVVVDTLDWATLGDHACSYTLHDEAETTLCYRGSFSVTR